MFKPKFKYFLSAADDEMKSDYQFGLASALSKFGVDQVILTTVEKNNHEDTYIIAAQLNSGEDIGGIRIEIKSPLNLLPIEKCDIQQKEIINNRIKQLTEGNRLIAELSGLWVNDDYKGLGLGKRLVLEATELALGLGVNIITAMPPTHTKPYFTSLGFVPDAEIPLLAYPDDRYISTVVMFFNPNQSKLIIEDKVALNQLDFEV